MLDTCSGRPATLARYEDIYDIPLCYLKKPTRLIPPLPSFSLFPSQVRLSTAEQLPSLARTLVTSGGEEGYALVIKTLLPVIGACVCVIREMRFRPLLACAYLLSLAAAGLRLPHTAAPVGKPAHLLSPLFWHGKTSLQ